MIEIVEHLKKYGLQSLKDWNIRVSYHSSYPIFLLKYSQIESPLQIKAVQQCRGIILDNKFNIVAYPFSKFFNFGETGAHPIDWDSAFFTEKVDGSLCTVFYYDNMWHVATSGSVDASGSVGDWEKSFKELFWETWDSLEYGEPSNKNMTYMFELMTPYNQIVINHQKSRLVLHGVRDNITLEEYFPQDYANHNWETIKVYRDINFNNYESKLKEIPGSEREGFVVVDRNWNRVKIKNEDYVKLHHLVSGTSVKSLVDLMRNNESSEVLTYFPHFIPIFEKIRDKYEKLYQDIVLHYNCAIFSAKKRPPTDKEFAEYALQFKFSDALFKMKKGMDARAWLSKISTEKLIALLELDQ